MKTLICLSMALSLLAAASVAAGNGAGAELRNAKDEKVGTAVFSAEGKNVKIVVEVHGLTPGLHGMHIHEAGKCEPPEFKGAGGHFNPTGRKHGADNPEGPHAGDLANLMVGEDGMGSMEVIASMVTLDDGPSSLFHPGGTALVIHAGPDDFKTDPAGNAGARVACGVITRTGP